MNILSKKECYIFDLDGTLIDSSLSHEESFIKTLVNCGYDGEFDYEKVYGK